MLVQSIRQKRIFSLGGYALSMAQRGDAQTLTEHVRGLLRGGILSGLLEPGERLQPAVLARKHGTSTTVIREALARLNSEGLVIAHPNHGFYVKDLALSELRDLTLVRSHNDTFALQLAIERGDVTWEAGIMSAYHILSQTPRRTPDDPTHTSEAWSVAHRAFHIKLVEACGIRMLIETSEALFDTTELYRRWAAPSADASKRSVDDEHRAILEACLARDANQAQEKLQAHYETSLQVILKAGLTSDSDTLSWSPGGGRE